MIRHQRRLSPTEGLKVDHLRLVMGTSMGGMHRWLCGDDDADSGLDTLMPLASLPERRFGGVTRPECGTRSSLTRSAPTRNQKTGEYTAQPRGLRPAAQML